MKRILSTTLALVSVAVFSSAALAQGRHDEKPHGVMKSVPAATEQTRSAGTGGRHDEGGTSHGKRKPAAKKERAPGEDASKGS